MCKQFTLEKNDHRLVELDKKTRCFQRMVTKLPVQMKFLSFVLKMVDLAVNTTFAVL